MMKSKKFLRALCVSLGLVLGGAIAAWAGGIYQGFPVPSTSNSTYPLTGNETIAADTNLASGVNPQTILPTIAQIRNFASVSPISFTTGTLQYDASVADAYSTTLTGNTTLGTPANLQAGKSWRVIFTQDSTGGRTVSTPSGCSANPCSLYRMSAGPPGGGNISIGTTLSQSSIATFTYDGSQIMITTAINFR